MFSRIWTKASTHDCSAQCDKLRTLLSESDTILVGAGSGLSTAAGFTYDGERFDRYFSDFAEKYHIRDMYAGGFYPFETQEEYWAYWSRYVLINRYQDAPKPVYDMLLSLLRNKDYFVLTTNVDHCFQKAGIDKKRLFYTQGDYGLFQCGAPCCPKTYDNEARIRQMVEETANMRIPSGLIPVCPCCGRPMIMNLRCDDRFVEDEGWHRAAERYASFLHTHRGGRILYLELGVGFNTPGIIKYPFWQRIAQDPNAVYVCINAQEAVCPQDIAPRALCIRTDIAACLETLCG
ncbi:MAG: Sir2 silent information regulator family NAD-dependent deacetylase [Eubacteriales bacterium]|nr:Sir2 silent information regulator family NAD-dependent deacetylase [Eubacteriales bacterium]